MVCWRELDVAIEMELRKISQMCLHSTGAARSILPLSCVCRRIKGGYMTAAAKFITGRAGKKPASLAGHSIKATTLWLSKITI